jgi:hypothetical protein
MSGLEDAVLRNIEAVSELSNLVRTSFGPNGTWCRSSPPTGRVDGDSGRNKLVINHLGRLFVTSDAATIIREIEVVHPAAKLLVMASQAQETEVSPASVYYVGRSTRTFGSDGGRNKHGVNPRWRAAKEGGKSIDHGSAPK